MAAPYKYTPFPPDTDQIRLLTLLPASEQDEGEIVITLQNSSTKAAAGQYEALSYVWGSPDNPETISVVTSSTTGAEEDDDAAPLLVTRNLAIALRHLRWRDAARTLWIDAICIDQQNVAERSEQVGKMGQIYSSAAQVVVWLGPASSDSDVGMRLVGHLGQVLRFDFESKALTSTSNGEADAHWADLDQMLPYEETEVCALEELFLRPWFERLWVVQEVLTSSKAVVICGSQETTWQSVVVAASCLLRKGTKTVTSDEFAHRLYEFEDIFDTSFSPPLQALVHHTRGLKCADDRDKIYAVLSLAKDVGNIKPDYSLSTIEVYRELAVHSMSEHWLKFLSDCELSSRRLAGPSWIPDWTVERTTTPIEGCNAAEFAWQPVIERRAEGCIQVTAVHVGTIADTDVVSMPLWASSKPILSEIVRLLPADIESSTYKTGCSLMEAFSGTLICEGLIPHVPQTPGFPTLQKRMNTLRAGLRWRDGLGFENTIDTRTYLSYVYAFTKNRALIRTKEGHIGLAPSDVKEGDIILAILSCESFTVVRPAPGNEGRFNVVGEAFLYGLSNGEAVLGPLPEHVSAEKHYRPDIGGFYDAYRDTRTGGVSWIDPRYEALGIPNKTRPDGLMDRVSEDELENAGIRLSKIDLV